MNKIPSSGRRGSIDDSTSELLHAIDKQLDHSHKLCVRSDEIVKYYASAKMCKTGSEMMIKSQVTVSIGSSLVQTKGCIGTRKNLNSQYLQHHECTMMFAPVHKATTRWMNGSL